MKSWDNTRKSYVNWLSKSDLRKEFSEKIKFEELSFWWLTSLLNKDNNNRRVLNLNAANNDEFQFLLSNKVVYSIFLLGFNELKMVNITYKNLDKKPFEL